jgi:hypothetical protein
MAVPQEKIFWQMFVKKKREPKLNEPGKRLMVIAKSANSPLTKSLVEVFLKVKRNSVRYIDRNGECFPSAENSSPSNGRLERQMKRLDASLFVYLHPSKSGGVKAVFGRTFEYEIIDLCVYEVVAEKSVAVKVPEIETNSLGLVYVNGRSENPRVQNLLMDIFREDAPKVVGISVCTHMFALSFTEDSFVLDVLRIEDRPLSLHSLMPPLEFTLQRNYQCDEEMFAHCKRTEREEDRKRKNVVEGGLKTKLGVLHMERQDLSEIKLVKGKAFRKPRGSD